MEAFANLLPAEFLNPEVLPGLSFDAQAYFRCDACGWEWRFNPAVNFLTPKDYEGQACPAEDGGRMSLVIHALRMDLRCSECGHRWVVEQRGILQAISCTECGSTKYVLVDSSLRLPGRFKNISLLGATRDHVWGHAPESDAQAITAELEGLMQYRSDGPNYLVPAIRFAHRLQACNEYPESSDWVIANIEAVYLNEFYRHTALFEAGLKALTKAMEITVGDHPPFVRAALEHNVAMDAYSLAARNQPELVVVGGLNKVRAMGIEAAESSLAYYLESCDDSENVRLQVARVRHTLGDLLKVGSASEADLDLSIRQLNLAIAEPALPEHMRAGAQESRATAVMLRNRGRTQPDAAEWTSSAEQDLLASLPNVRRMRDPYLILMQLADLSEHRGRRDEALGYVKDAAGIAQQELLAARTNAAVTLAANQFCGAFDSLARLRAEAGRHRSALEALETTRAANLRNAYASTVDVAARADTAARNRFIRQILGRPPAWLRQPTSARPAEGLRKEVTAAARKVKLRVAEATTSTPLVDRALERLDLARWPVDTAICVLTAARGWITAIVLYRAGTDWRFESRQSLINEERLIGIAKGHNLDPGVFRSRHLLRSCRQLNHLFTDELAALLRSAKIKKLAISAPGWLNHLPYEATAVEGSVLLDSFEICYLPSLSVGGELAGIAAAASGSASPALVVAYGGSDLPRTAEEVAAITRLLPGNVDVIDGTRATKADVLNALSRTYSIIHLACHGTFDPVEPDRSFLYFDADHERDSKRVSAAELSAVRFPQAPIVTLSACSSGLTSYGPMNECAGLTGSLIKAGARGIIASRWPIYDDVASAFMTELYGHLGAGVGPQEAVNRVQRQLKPTTEVENWAAYSYLGAPALDKPVAN